MIVKPVRVNRFLFHKLVLFFKMQKRGFTLIEMLVAMTVFITIAVLVIQITISTLRLYRISIAFLKTSQQNALFVSNIALNAKYLGKTTSGGKSTSFICGYYDHEAFSIGSYIPITDEYYNAIDYNTPLCGGMFSWSQAWIPTPPILGNDGTGLGNGGTGRFLSFKDSSNYYHLYGSFVKQMSSSNAEAYQIAFKSKSLDDVNTYLEPILSSLLTHNYKNSQYGIAPALVKGTVYNDQSYSSKRNFISSTVDTAAHRYRVLQIFETLTPSYVPAKNRSVMYQTSVVVR